MSAKIIPFPTIARVKEQVREQFSNPAADLLDALREFREKQERDRRTNEQLAHAAAYGKRRMVHNHGPEEGPGLGCRERRINGRLVGDCIKSTDPDAA